MCIRDRDIPYFISVLLWVHITFNVYIDLSKELITTFAFIFNSTLPMPNCTQKVQNVQFYPTEMLQMFVQCPINELLKFRITVVEYSHDCVRACTYIGKDGGTKNR